MINSNPLLEYLEDDKTYDLDFGSTWNAINDGSTSKYAYHTIKCILIFRRFNSRRTLLLIYVQMILNRHLWLNLNRQN